MKTMSEILINDLVEELSEENKRLLNELSFERQLNEMLENFRKYSLDLKTNCFCDNNKQTFDLLDQLDIEYKTLFNTRQRVVCQPSVVIKSFARKRPQLMPQKHIKSEDQTQDTVIEVHA